MLIKKNGAATERVGGAPFEVAVRLWIKGDRAPHRGAASGGYVASVACAWARGPSIGAGRL